MCALVAFRCAELQAVAAASCHGSSTQLVALHALFRAPASERLQTVARLELAAKHICSVAYAQAKRSAWQLGLNNWRYICV
eukprot:16234-Heterococcus_DN1.PRE.4